MAMYKSTPAYQAYVQAKSRGNPVIEDPEPKGILTYSLKLDRPLKFYELSSFSDSNVRKLSKLY